MFHVKQLRLEIALLALLVFALPAIAQESWVVPVGDDLYRQAEEVFLERWQVPPFDEQPLIADDLNRHLTRLKDAAGAEEDPAPGREAPYDDIDSLLPALALPFSPISPILQAGISAGFNSETGMEHYIASNAGSDGRFLDYLSLYEANSEPSLLKIGFIAQAAGFSLLFQPELRESANSLIKDYNITNFPGALSAIDTGFPFRGIACFSSAPFEVRVGRDKLHVGPGRWSTLTLNRSVPYFDYVKARFFLEGFSVAWYYVRLNPTINAAESHYLDKLYINNENPEPNAWLNGKIYNDRVKHYIIGKLVVTPFHWLSLSVAQTNLIGGRLPQIADFNPLIIFHNTYAEGVYSVPLSLSATFVPYRGIKIYGEFLLYDATVGDERDPTKNPGALAYQAGLTVLSTPFVDLGAARFRFDGEFALIDPWVYGKHYSLRQFTTRFIYVEHFGNRSWVDYPLGYYLGPDVVDWHLKLSFGVPADKEVEIYWNRSGIGQVDLYGFGSESDYAYAGINFPLSGSPTGLVQWTDQIRLSGYWYPIRGLRLSLWYRLKIVANRYHVDGDNHVFHYAGVGAVWNFF